MFFHTGIATAIAPAASLMKTDALDVAPLGDDDIAEVLAFLAERPIHTVMMAGLIRDNGLVSALNRGTFYGCRDQSGCLEGVVLIGEIMMLEARNEAALAASARLAQGYPSAYMIIGEQEKIERFWTYYHGSGQTPRLFCRELLFQLGWPAKHREPVSGLRLATMDDLEIVMPVHAAMAFEESGINPLEVDPNGFRQRCARRINQQRVWVWTEGRRVIFKADVVSETAEVTYLEGVYVDPDERRKAVGLRCISQLSQRLLTRTKLLCLLVNDENPEAQTLYRKARYQFRGYYHTIFLQQQSN
ncbi:MAG: GNAT family N-acetyltransferase [Pyrinomonadaceae bacterium]